MTAADKARFWADVASFGREIVIVVIGVALGLWAQQVVSDAGWRDTVAVTKKTLNGEMEDNLYNARWISLLRPCSKRFEDGAARFLDEAEAMAGRRLPARAGVQQVVFSDSAWRAALASQVVTHMPPEEISKYADVYSYVDALAVAQEKAVDALPPLRLIGDGRRVSDPRILEDRRAALGRFKYFMRHEGLRADHLIEAVERRLRLKLPADEVADLRKDAAECEAQAVRALDGAAPDAAPAKG